MMGFDTVAIGESIWKSDGDMRISEKMSDSLIHDSTGGDTIYIIITKNNNFFFTTDGIVYPLYSFFTIMKFGGINPKFVGLWIQKVLSMICNTSNSQKSS